MTSMVKYVVLSDLKMSSHYRPPKSPTPGNILLTRLLYSTSILSYFKAGCFVEGESICQGNAHLLIHKKDHMQCSMKARGVF